MQASITTTSVPNTNQVYPGSFRCSLLKDGAQITSQVSPGAGPFSFTLANPVPAGSYTATAERLSLTTGQPISALVTSAPLVVSAPESFDVPVTITLSL